MVWSQAETRCGGPTIASSEAQVVTLELPTGLPLPPWQSPSCCHSSEARWRIDDDYGGCEGSRGGIHRRIGFDFIAGTGIGGKAALDV